MSQKKMKLISYLIRINVFMIILILSILIISQVGLAADYGLNIGDQLYISVWGHPDLQQEVAVGPDGQISFPLVGEIKAEGLTVDQLTKKITQKLQRYIKVKKSKINVMLKKYEKVKVMVLGEVKKPGVYQITGDKRVLDVISLAGGVTKVADLNNVRLTRKDKSLSINLEALLKGEVQGQNYKLHAGDALYISEGMIEVNVVGEVRKPGSYKVEKGTRLSDILARAGDVTAKASDKVKYISGEKKQILSLKKLFNNEKQNPILQNGDIIYALESRYNLQKLSFWKNIFFFAGGLNEVKDLLD